MFYKLSKSYRPDKKFMVITPENKSIHFGAKYPSGEAYSDFTIHKDEKRKMNYISRHTPNEDWSDLSKAGTWSRYILWNKPTLIGSVRDMEKQFKIKIKLSL